MKRHLYSAAAAACLCLTSGAFAADTQEQAGPVLDVKQLPAPVQATLQNEGRVTKVERENEGGKSFYEASVSKDGKNYLLHIGDDGKILKRETAKDEKK
jgi:uncharacterized membrane protein YkoI